MPADSKTYLRTLDGWRAIAIAAVLICHSQTELFGAHGMWPNPTLGRLADQGRYGVDLFFALSGFLITSLLLAEQRANGTIAVGRFYGRRLTRIVPTLALLLVALAGGVLLRRFAVERQEWLGVLFFARNYVPGSLWTQHLWSLAVEEHFYLIWPIALVLLPGQRRGRVLVVAAALAAVVVWRFVWCAQLVPVSLESDALAPMRHTDTRFDALLWGAVFAMIHANPRGRVLLQRVAGRKLFFIALASFLASSWLPLAANLTVKAATAPLLIVATVLHATGPLGRLLEARPIRFVGRVSYALYLLQQLFLPFTPLRLLLLAAVTVTVHYAVELPWIAYGQARFGGWRRAHASERRGARRGLPLAALAVTLVALSLAAWPRLLRRPSEAVAPDGVAVTLFADADFGGDALTVRGGRVDRAQLGAMINRASSLIVGKRARVRVCALGEHTCRSYPPGARIGYVGDELNDRANVIDVWAR